LLYAVPLKGATRLDPKGGLGEGRSVLKSILRFLTNLNAKAWRTLVLSFVLFGGVGLVFLFGASFLGLDGERTVESWLATAANGPWALPVAVGAFSGLAFLGVPQFVLIAAAVVTFGPWHGLAYSWIGTLTSSAIGFWVGRMFGGRLLRDVGGEGLNRFMRLIGRNGFLASLIVRQVPMAPFIVVNMAAGVTPMRLRDFLGGTALGIIPKIALTAFAGNSAVAAIRGEGGIRQYLVLGGLARAWLIRRESDFEAEKDPSAPTDGG
jgi:uncharacterized membrane protein YdjX (TVP38/TMEM64 family)